MHTYFIKRLLRQAMLETDELDHHCHNYFAIFYSDVKVMLFKFTNVVIFIVKVTLSVSF